METLSSVESFKGSEKKLTLKISLCGITIYKRTREETEKDYMQEGHKKYSFPYKSIEAWNKLDADVINVRNSHDFKSKLDNSRFGDGTV